MRSSVTVSSSAAESAGNDFYPVVAIDAKGNRINGLKIEPLEVSVSLQLVDAPATKSVLISANITQQPVFPYRIMGITVTPPYVTIFGSSDDVSRTSTILTDDIDLADAKSAVTKVVGLRTPSGIRTGNTQTVRVTVRITQQQ